jgi:glycine cleavage system pyridoxal-binding protein P
MISGITKMDIAVASMLDHGQVAMDLLTLMKNQSKHSEILVKF